MYSNSARDWKATSGTSQAETRTREARRMMSGKYCRMEYCGAVGGMVHRAQRLERNVHAATKPATWKPVHRLTTTWRAHAVRAIETRNVTLIASAGLPVARKTGAKYGSAPNPGGP